MSGSQRTWLRGPLPRGEAEDMLALDGLTNGLFLVRERLNPPGELALVIAHRSKAHHYLIRQKDERFSCGTSGSFIDLDSLIDFVKYNDAGLCCKLVQPCGMRSKYYEEVELKEEAEGATNPLALDHHSPVKSPLLSSSPTKVSSSPIPSRRNIFSRLKCLTEVHDEGLRQTFAVQFMGAHEVETDFEATKAHISSTIVKIAQKKKRQPVTLMISPEGLKIVQNKKKIITLQYPAEQLLCCLSSEIKQSHFAAVIEEGQRFVILAFKDHRSAVGSVEEILQVVTGLIKTNSKLREKTRKIGTFDQSSMDTAEPASARASDTMSSRPPAPLPPELEHGSPLLEQNPQPQRVRPLSVPDFPVSQTRRSPKRASEPDVLHPIIHERPRLQEPEPEPGPDPNHHYVNADLNAHYVNASRIKIDVINKQLPDGWTAHWSDRSNRIFYYNSERYLTTWEKPT